MGGRLQDKVAFITGIGAIGPGWGNGKATAVLFAREGARVFGVDIVPAAAEETRGIVEAEGGTCAVRACDATDGAAVEADVREVNAWVGGWSVPPSNAGGWSAPRS